jgi:hypothetical protein
MAERPQVEAQQQRSGLSRREMLRRAGILGGTLLWVAPAVQTLTPPAYADVSPGISTCCQCTKVSGPGPARRCFADDPTANTPGSCTTKCTTFQQTPANPNYTAEFHQDFPAGSGKSFSCRPEGVNSDCIPVPH